MGRMPVARGSRVPAWPAFCASKMRFTTLTAWVEVMSAGLSRISQPSTFWPFLRRIVAVLVIRVFLIIAFRDVAGDDGIVQQTLDLARLLEGLVFLEADLRGELQLHDPHQLAPEIAGGAVQRGDQRLGIAAAE